MEASTKASTEYYLLNSDASALDITSLPTLAITIDNSSLSTSASSTDVKVKYTKQSDQEWFDVAAYGGVEIWLKYDKRFLTNTTGGQADVPTGLTDPTNASVFEYFNIVTSQVPNGNEIHGNATFTRNENGSSLTSILTNNSAAIPVTAIVIGSGLRKTSFITVDYTS